MLLGESLSMKQKWAESKMNMRMEAVSEKMKLSSDILAGAPIVTVIGQTELSVENYKGIIEYTGDLLRIQTKTGRIHIEGKNLVIRQFSEDGMKVSGFIRIIQYI